MTALSPHGYFKLYESDSVLVVRSATEWETYRVIPAAGKARTFRGESACANAERYAGDYDMAAWGCTQ